MVLQENSSLTNLYFMASRLIRLTKIDQSYRMRSAATRHALPPLTPIWLALALDLISARNARVSCIKWRTQSKIWFYYTLPYVKECNL